MSDYKAMCHIDNLTRAYRWLTTNPEPSYKNLFRDLFANYALSSITNLRQLSLQLKGNKYYAKSASKIFNPKASGTLRPMTLLSVEDQIIYQACVNIIAEKLFKKTRKRYHKSVFQHLYAGKTSLFFYKKWQDSYKKYNQSILAAAKKSSFYADFDLTAFYDTIDHTVLKFFLTELRISQDLSDFLLDCLRVWTSITWPTTSNLIVHSHGIPQGPLSSGMLAECVLQYIDDAGTRGRSVHYFRYVDDIKLLANSRGSLGRRIVSLDLACKEIALFPQTSKLNIGPIQDPTQLIKSPSIPNEPAVYPVLNQDRLQKRILELSRGGTIIKGNSTTKFKYLLARAKPTYKLNARLVNILENHPELSKTISAYFSRYTTVPKKAAGMILQYLKGEELYHSVFSDVLNSVLDNMNNHFRGAYIDYCKNRLFKIRGKLRLQPSLKLSLVTWLMRNNSLSYMEFERIFNEETDWWLQSKYVGLISIRHYGRHTYQAFLNRSLSITSPEVARSVAAKIIGDRIRLTAKTADIVYEAQLPLVATRKIRRAGSPASLIHTILVHIFMNFGRLNTFDWISFCGRKHSHAESIAIAMKQCYETDIDAFVVRFDSFCDYIYEIAWGKINTGRSYGNYGSMLLNPTLNGQLPRTCIGFKQLHDLRLKSITAHPRDHKRKKTTKRISHRQFYLVRKPLFVAFSEFIAYFP